MLATAHAVVFDEDRDRASRIAEILERTQGRFDSRSISTFHDLKGSYAPPEGILAIKGGLPTLAILVEADRSKTCFPDVLELARQRGLATLVITDPDDDPGALALKVRGSDGWLALDAIDRELPARISDVLDRRERRIQGGSKFPVIDPTFLALVVHDLRTPLNVIGLTIQAITRTVPNRSPELDEDLAYLKENASQIEKMLAHLGDYCRLIEGNSDLQSAEFDPRRFLADFLEVHRSRPGSEATPIRLELTETSPVEVMLDQNRVRLALQYALANAINAASKTPIRLRSSGTSDRWVLELIVDKPPPASVTSHALRTDTFERLTGSPAERRGLDLAIVAHLCEMLGGSARLEAEPDRRSSIVINWPQRTAAG